MHPLFCLSRCTAVMMSSDKKTYDACLKTGRSIVLCRSRLALKINMNTFFESEGLVASGKPDWSMSRSDTRRSMMLLAGHQYAFLCLRVHHPVQQSRQRHSAQISFSSLLSWSPSFFAFAYRVLAFSLPRFILFWLCCCVSWSMCHAFSSQDVPLNMRECSIRAHPIQANKCVRYDVR